MIYSWYKTVIPIAAIFSFRMLGLFLLIPVFTLYAPSLTSATPALVGIALGGYGLTQGLLQIPFGLLSDKWGRKPILILGLFFFACGSLLGALTHSIYGMIVARILQGTGAIGSVLIALLADLTPDTQRTKAMAVIGMTIGTSFSLAMVISPALTHYFGLAGIFYLTVILACLGIILVQTIIPIPPKELFHSDSEANPLLLKTVIKNAQLQILNMGIFCQHFILTATFFAIPLLLKEHIQQGHLVQQWHFYLPLMVFSFVLMIPFIIFAEKKKSMKRVFLLSVITLTLGQFFLAFFHLTWFYLCLLMFVYFTAFNILEACLPSLVSKQANPNQKGTAMGVYSTGQFLGIFAGGTAAGILYQWQGSVAIFFTNGILGILWFMVTRSMQPNKYLSTLILSFSSQEENSLLNQRLLQIPGVREVVIAPTESIIYIRVEQDSYQAGTVEKVLNAYRKN